MKHSSVVLLLSVIGSLTGSVHAEAKQPCPPDTTELPTNVRVQDSIDGAQVFVRDRDDWRKLNLGGLVWMMELRQVCRIDSARFLLIGDAGRGLSALILLDANVGAMMDAFYAYSPALSPDRKWLAFRRFYPLTSYGSEQYMLYATTARPERNRSRDVIGQEVVGRLMFPAADPIPLNVDLPEAETHNSRSRQFVWSGDSSSVVFADQGEGRFSVVLVKVLEPAPAVLVKPLDVSPCKSESHRGEYLQVVDVSFDTQDRIALRFEPCAATEVVLNVTDFAPAQVKRMDPVTLVPSERTERPLTRTP